MEAHNGLSAKIAEEAGVDAAIARQKAFDPDLWVIEVEDRQGRHLLDQPGTHAERVLVENSVVNVVQPDGQVVHTRVPRQRKPVEEYLKLQGRFAHLFAPARNESLLADLQHSVDGYWAGVDSAGPEAPGAR